MEYVKRLPESQSSTSQQHIMSTPMNNGTSSVVTADPFHFDAIGESEASTTGYGGRHIGGPTERYGLLVMSWSIYFKSK